ncbi:MAG: DUF1415 domain-containing protein [Piscirickettsiaceae bacterium]|nr:DUF1415 domain-containing protein [Piscirickettsiaceae bacterium]
MEQDIIIQSVRHWVETLVVDLNLCPFAKRELLNNRIRFSTTEVSTEQQLLQQLQTELALLTNDESIETTLLIHPNVLQNFYDYNEFLDVVEGLLIDLKLEGVFQIASFHPDYQFADTEPDDVENYTNRSPFPLLHIIREDSLEKAIANYPESDKIPERNIALLRHLGRDKMKALFQSHFDNASH